MNAILLCAGFATRMYPLTKDYPKPLLAVAGRPVLDYLIEQLCSIPQLENIHIVSNARFHDHFEHWRAEHRRHSTFGSTVIHIHNDGAYSNDNRLGAAGDLRLALETIDRPRSILVSGGDNIYNFSLSSLWSEFQRRRHHHIVALAIADRAQLHKTGVLQFGVEDRVIRLHEKPAHPPSHWGCPPLYFFRSSVRAHLYDFLSSNGNGDAPGHFIDYLCRHDVVKAFRLESSRYDIGSIESYREADRQLRQRTAGARRK
jgi:glucose-1-phosphate thymidylyltransferase